MAPPVQGYTASHERDSRTTGQCFDELTLPPRKYHQRLTSYAHPDTLAEDIAAARKSSRSLQVTGLTSSCMSSAMLVASGVLCSSVIGSSYFSDFPLGGKGFNGMAFIASLGMLTFLTGFGGVQAFTAVRDWLRASNRDAQQPDTTLLEAITTCSVSDTDRSEVVKAAQVCLRNLRVPGGAIVTAHALTGLHRGLSRIGASEEMVELCQELGFACPGRYSGLPVQSELVKFFLSEAPRLFPLCEGKEQAGHLAESLGQLVIMASKGEEKSRCEALAVELHTLARGIPEVLVGARCELLNTARNIVPKNTPIAENVELQLREVQELKEKVVHYSER